MKGMFQKELYTMKGQFKSWGAVLVLMTVYSIMLKSSSFLYMLIAMIGLMGPMTTFSLDQMSHWDCFALSLPVTRREMVRCKYLFSLFCVGVTIVPCLALSMLINIVLKEMSIGEMLGSIGSILVVVVFLLAVLLPTIYKLGVEKARYVYMAIFIGVALLVFWLLRLAEGTKGLLLAVGRLLSEHPASSWAVAALAAALLLALSYRLSVAVYEKKDL